MGLDIVELVMAVEEKFGVDITDEEAEEAITVGLLHELVVRKLELRGAPTEGSWEKLRGTIVEQLGVEREDVTEGARWVDDLGAD